MSRVYDSFNMYARKDISSGLWLNFITPILLLLTGFQNLALEFLFASVTLTTILLIDKLNYFKLTIIPFYSFVQLNLNVSNLFLLIRPFLLIIFTFYTIRNILHFYPQTFTVGESFLLTHLITIFLLTQCNFIVPFLLLFLIEYYSVTFSVYNLSMFIIITLFLTILVWLSFCRVKISINFLLHEIFCYISLSNFYIIIIWLILFVSCISLIIWTHLNKSASNELFEKKIKSINSDLEINKSSCENYSVLPPTSITIESSTIDANATSFIIIPSSSKTTTENTSDDFFEDCYEQLNENQSHQEISNMKVDCKELIAQSQFTALYFNSRKVFHFAAGFVYAIGLVYSPNLLSIASAMLLLLFFCFEWARRRGTSPIINYLNEIVNPFLDDKDSGTLIFTPISLLLGLSIPIWWPSVQVESTIINIDDFCPKFVVEPFCWSGVLSIAVGDSFAALIGRSYGRIRWPGSHRTVFGSAFSFLSQLLLWIVISSYYSWNWFNGILPILISVLVEAYTDQIDNLVVPLVTMILFNEKLFLFK